MATQTKFTLRNITVDVSNYAPDYQDWVESAYNTLFNIDAHFTTALAGINVNFTVNYFNADNDGIEYSVEACTPNTGHGCYNNHVCCKLDVRIFRSELCHSYANYIIDIGHRRQQIPKSVLGSVKGIRASIMKYRLFYRNVADIASDVDIVIGQKMHLIRRNNDATVKQLAREAEQKLDIELNSLAIPAIIEEALAKVNMTNDQEKLFKDGYSWDPNCRYFYGRYFTTCGSDYAKVIFCPDDCNIELNVTMRPNRADNKNYRLSISGRHGSVINAVNNVPGRDDELNTTASKASANLANAVSRVFDTYCDMTEEELKCMIARVLKASTVYKNLFAELDELAPYSYDR